MVSELTDDLLMAQAFLFLTAGFDTTSTTLEFLLFELSRNPKAHDKLREELLRVIQEEGDKLTYNSMAKLTYMDKCIKGTILIFNRLC
jgi:cytochrome P450